MGEKGPQWAISYWIREVYEIAENPGPSSSYGYNPYIATASAVGVGKKFGLPPVRNGRTLMYNGWWRL
jgi:hypothetical protein